MSRFKSSGWKSDTLTRANTTSSIRGKISSPIPITVGNDEFPIRTRAASIATPFGLEDIEKQLRSPKPHVNVQHGGPLSNEMEVLSRLVPSSSTPPTSHSSVQQAAQAASLKEVTSHEPSIEKPQRKKSTLRSVLGRLFGKKRKSDDSTVSNGVAAPASGRTGQHRSDPTALRKPLSRMSQPRSTSMPINEYNRALSSHSPFPTSDRETGGSTQSDGRTQPKQGTALPKSPGFTDWTGLTPRPASSYARSSRITMDDGQPPIGYALTSGSHPNRRSRSLGQLKDAAATSNNVRRRSDEIRYWRESYDPEALSPMSSQRHDGDYLLSPSDKQEERILEPPQPFNFGPMGEMAGMKITQAASLETRVSRLEVRLEKMERIMGRLQGRISGSLILQDSPLGQPVYGSYARQSRRGSSDFSLPKLSLGKIYQRTQNPQIDMSHDIQMNDSSRPSTDSTQDSYRHTFEDLSPRPPFSSSPAPNTLGESESSSLAVEPTGSMGRPLSTSTTIRGVPSSSPNRGAPLAKGGTLTAHHYTALLNLIQAEQSARSALEAQVSMLQHQLESLLQSSSVGAGAAYPTPSSDELANQSPIGVVHSEFSNFEQGSEGESEEEEENYDNDEVYRTPTEDRSQYGVQEGNDRETGRLEGEEQTRTLSLSQLTLRKGVPVL